MKKVFLIHGYQGSPNGGWRPWMMAELEEKDIYACALPMPSPDAPVPDEWSEEIDRQIKVSVGDEVYLVGHSLGVPAILRYLSILSDDHPVKGAVLVSGPAFSVGREHVDRFFADELDFEVIRSKVNHWAVIHGDDDPLVPLEHANFLTERLGAEMIVVPGGGHLNGSSGWRTLPQGMEVLMRMIDAS